MNKYEYLVEYATECGAEVIELDLETTRACGKCINDLLIINKNMTLKDKFCILSEELGHYKTTTGNITNQSIISNRKQELKARAWGYEITIGLKGLIDSFLMQSTIGFPPFTKLYLPQCLIANSLVLSLYFISL